MDTRKDQSIGGRRQPKCIHRWIAWPRIVVFEHPKHTQLAQRADSLRYRRPKAAIDGGSGCRNAASPTQSLIAREGSRKNL